MSLTARSVAWGAVVALALLLLWLAAGRLRSQRYTIERARLVRSRVDGEEYRVHLSHRDPAGAADRLAVLHFLSVELLDHLKNKYQRGRASRGVETRRGGGPGPVRRRGEEITRNLLARYDPDTLAESSPLNAEGDTSFTVNKGELLAFCLRERDPGETGDPEVHDFHNWIDLWFVAVHELTHVGIDEKGHPPEFWSAFKLLLAEAEDAALVPGGGRWPDYEARPVRYCGLEINYNPLLDPGVPFP